MTERLPGIARVEWASMVVFPFDRLALPRYRAAADPHGVFLRLPTVGRGSMECTSQRQDGVTLRRTTLRFRTSAPPPADIMEPLCLLAYDVEGNGYVIGTGEAPHPVMEAAEVNGTDRWHDVTVTWTSPVGYMRLAR